MARSTSFGDILRETRIRRGLGVDAVARRLRIRVDILQAIEDGDFLRMPPRGYSKSMIAAYSRLLGLNPADLVKRYENQLYAFEIGRVRNDSLHDISTNMRSSSYREDSDLDGSSRRRTNDSRSSRRSIARPQFSKRSEPQGRTYSSDRVHTSRNVSLPNSQYTNLVASPRIHKSTNKKPYVFLGGFALLVVVLLAIFVFGGKDNQSVEDVPSVPISGLTDTSNPVEDTADANIPTPPTSVEFEYEVLEGEEAYYEIYLDDAEKPSEAGTLTGPVSERYDVVGTLRFVTARPSAVIVSVNDEPVTLTDDDGNGVYEYTVDFPQILAQWQTANQAAIDAAEAAASATNTGEDAGEDTNAQE